MDAQRGLSQRQSRNGFDCTAPFRAGAAQKLEASRQVVEQLGNGDCGAALTRDSLWGSNATARHAHAGPLAILGGGLDLELRHRRNRRQRFPAESERRHSDKVRSAANLGSSVTSE